MLIKRIIGQAVKSFAVDKRLPSFNHYSLLPELKEFLQKKQIKAPSPIQQQTFQVFFNEKAKLKRKEAFFIGGPTGCGKTLSYLIPISQKLKEQERKEEMNFAIASSP